MAKLSAHGTEVARLVVSETRERDDFSIGLYGEAERVERFEHHFSFRSDGHILARMVGLDVHPGETSPSRRRHDFGWKLWKRLQDPKRDTRARQTKLAHSMAVSAEAKGKLIDIKAAPH